MPYKSEKMKIAGTKYDRRRKLTDEQKDQIIALRGTISQSKCAEMFKVSKSTIVFLWYPEKQQANKQRRLERGGWRQYYRKDEHRETMKKTRRYKYGLYKEKRLADIQQLAKGVAPISEQQQGVIID